MKALLLAVLGIMAPLTPASAQSAYLETVCSQSERRNDETYCDQGVLFDLASDGSSTIYGLRVTAPPTHCAPIQYVVAWPPPPPPAPGTLHAVPTTPLTAYYYGPNFLNRTGTLWPGESELLNIGRGFARGQNRLMIMAIGIVQDCNVGAIQSWGVQVQATIIPE